MSAAPLPPSVVRQALAQYEAANAKAIQAITSSDMDKLSTAISLGADLSSLVIKKDRSSRNVLVAAVCSGNRQLLSHLLSLDISPDLSRGADTPLLAATRMNDAKAIRILLTAGADPWKAAGKETPLDSAARFGSASCLRLLVKAARRLPGGQEKLQEWATSFLRNGSVPANPSIIRQILDIPKRFSAEVVQEIMWRNIISAEAFQPEERGHLIRQLLLATDDVATASLGYVDTTLLCEALKKGQGEWVGPLVEAGLDPNLPSRMADPSGELPAPSCPSWWHASSPSTLLAVLRAGAIPIQFDTSSQMAWWEVACEDFLRHEQEAEVLRQLSSFGLSLDARNARQETALMHALMEDRGQSRRSRRHTAFMIAAGASLTAQLPEHLASMLEGGVSPGSSHDVGELLLQDHRQNPGAWRDTLFSDNLAAVVSQARLDASMGEVPTTHRPRM